MAELDSLVWGCLRLTPIIMARDEFRLFSCRYNSLREVPAYSNFIQERFERCLDLYLCPRQRRMRVSRGGGGGGGGVGERGRGEGGGIRERGEG